MSTPDIATLTEGHPERTPDAVMRHLLAGNQRFMHDQCTNLGRNQQRREMLRTGQAPIVTVLGCSDSRVAPEVLFDTGLGDVFSIRTAGHVMDEAVMGSLEYGVEVLKTPVILILGHQGCGALAAARQRAQGADLPDGHIRAIVWKILSGFVPTDIPTDEFAMLRAHVGNTASHLVESSVTVRDAVEEGRTTVVGMKYSLDNGEVRYVGHAGRVDTTGFPVARG